MGRQCRQGSQARKGSSSFVGCGLCRSAILCLRSLVRWAQPADSAFRSGPRLSPLPAALPLLCLLLDHRDAVVRACATSLVADAALACDANVLHEVVVVQGPDEGPEAAELTLAEAMATVALNGLECWAVRAAAVQVNDNGSAFQWKE